MNLLVRFSDTEHKKHTMARAHTIAKAMVCRFLRQTAESLASLFPKPVFRRPFPLEIPESTEEKPTVEIPKSTEEKSTAEIPEKPEERSMIGS